MTAKHRVIVNADDFGQSAGISRGIIHAHEHGIVTSASLMVRWPAAPEAAAYARSHPELSIGLHIDLGEWACRNGTWSPLYEVVQGDDAAAVEREVRHQMQEFERLVGRPPTHLDSHQHVHRKEPLGSFLRSIAEKLGVPLRHYSDVVRYCGDFYGATGTGAALTEQITVKSLLRILSELPPGITELGCHPGEDADLDSPYGVQRSQEVRVLCDPRVHEILTENEIVLCSFHDVPPGL